MNIFRSLIGKVWHDPNAAEVVKISTGQLFYLRPGNIRSERECIYNDAVATIRRAPNMEHHFQLVVTRAYEDEDQELLEDEDESEDERAFLVGEELQFRVGTHEGEPTLIWRDPDGDVDEVYEFQATGTNEPTRAFFETCMYRAMYERKYRRSADATTDADLQEFIWHPPAPKPKTPKKKTTASPHKESPPPEPLEPETVDPDVPASTEEPLPPNPHPQSPPSVSYPHWISEPAELWIWKMPEGEYHPRGSVTAQIVQRPSDPRYVHHLAIFDSDGGESLIHPVSSDMSQRFSHTVLSFGWNHVNSETGLNESFLLRLVDEETLDRFVQQFSGALWETSFQLPWTKLKADEQEYILSSNADEDVVMADPETDEEEEEAIADELDPDNEPSEDEEEDEELDEDGMPPPLAQGERNSQLTVGYKGDRSYVVRGSKIGVFSHADGSAVKYHATLNKVVNGKGKSFAPAKMMLHDQDTKMVLMNPGEPNSLYSMDIEAGKIVEEWKVHDDVPVSHIAPENKFAQMTHEQTLVGASGNALFRIDPRVSGNKMVDSQFKQYATKQKFSGVTTTKDGKLAVGSEKGEIRLFDSIGKNAKTALPPLGDPIIGIDVTADGRFIVATTKTYLLLVDTKIGQGRYTGSLGFDRSFPADAKPIPKRLQLRGEHVAYMGSQVSFTPARFNMGVDNEETAIVTSSGPFVIAWDFKKVQKGHLDKYEIKKYEDWVVQDNFKIGDDKQIIVALQNNVMTINKKNLKRPTRASLAPPRQSRSSIVNSPY